MMKERMNMNFLQPYRAQCNSTFHSDLHAVATRTLHQTHHRRIYVRTYTIYLNSGLLSPILISSSSPNLALTSSSVPNSSFLRLSL